MRASFSSPCLRMLPSTAKAAWCDCDVDSEWKITRSSQNAAIRAQSARYAGRSRLPASSLPITLAITKNGSI